MKKELAVGIFIFIGFCIIGISVFLIKDIRLQKGYRLTLYFDDVGNLMERAWVRMHGVKIGRVEKIFVKGDKANVVVWIDSDVKLYKGAKAKISSTGVLGVKYIEFIQGHHKEVLQDGDEIFETESVVSIDDALSSGVESIKKFGDFLSSVSREENLTQKLSKIISDIEEITGKVNKTITEKELKKTVESIQTAGNSLSEFFTESKQDINTAVLTLKNMTKKFDEIIDNIKSTYTVIGQIISDKESGKKLAETISSVKLVADKADKTLNRINMFTTYWDYRIRYDLNNEIPKSDVKIEVYPKTTKFYYLGIDNLSSEEQIVNEKYNTISLGIGGTFYDVLTLYGGLIRSYGGIGVRLFPLGYRSKLVELNLETYNFSKMKVLPNVDFGVKFKLTKWLYFGARYENILASEVLNTSVNVRFEDEDIAYLLGLIGLTR
ncbi:MAG: MlaD family protein [Endomicrobia bacterium]|nr:MlaD family protein [Endomicrobiia bacterium]